jgi:CRP/FNR family transcriptional regulator, cyclic AMP receptor protein
VRGTSSARPQLSVARLRLLLYHEHRGSYFGLVVGTHPIHSEHIRVFLKGNTFLGRLPDAALASLMDRGQLRQYSKKSVIYRRGEPGDSLMVVVKGRIKLTNVNVGGKEVVLHFLVPGNIYGEIAALDGKERAASAIALEESEVFLIYTRDLMPTLKAHPDAMLEVITALCEKVRAGAAMLEDSTLEMRARVARGLLRLARQHGQKGIEGICVPLALSQGELGNYLGLSRANVSRQLGQLKDANVIRIDGTQIVITDEGGLTDIADAASAKD